MPSQTTKFAETLNSMARKTPKGSKMVSGDKTIGGKTTSKARDSQLEDFIRRANDHKIGTEEPGSGGENWEVMDAQKVREGAEDAEDDQEWVMVDVSERGS
jgi:hypothetical protein